MKNNISYIIGKAVVTSLSNNQLPYFDQNTKNIFKSFTPKETLGKRGLAYKDRSTLMALCAVKHALSETDISYDETSDDIAVVVSTNLGNINTICETIEVLNNSNSDSLSALNTPIASSNVIASNIAIKFKFRGPNITLCNGSKSGTDALYISNNLIKSKRAKHVVVVGVEGSNEYVNKLLNQSLSHEEIPEVFDGAACVILSENKDNKSLNVVELIGTQTSTLENLGQLINDWIEPDTDYWLVPKLSVPKNAEKVRLIEGELSSKGNKLNLIDVSVCQGDMIGASGVFQCALASTLVKPDNNILATCGGNWSDDFSTFKVRGGV